MKTQDAPAVSADEALRIADADAQAVYRDLTPYQIRVALEDDGWHIDYELKDKRLKGGGPHYIVHASSAQITSKRYHQ